MTRSDVMAVVAEILDRADQAWDAKIAEFLEKRLETSSQAKAAKDSSVEGAP